MTLPKDTKGKYLYDFAVQDFLRSHKKAQIKKEKMGRLYYFKITNSFSLKATLRGWKNKPPSGENICNIYN